MILLVADFLNRGAAKQQQALPETKQLDPRNRRHHDLEIDMVESGRAALLMGQVRDVILDQWRLRAVQAYTGGAP